MSGIKSCCLCFPASSPWNEERICQGCYVALKKFCLSVRKLMAQDKSREVSGRSASSASQEELEYASKIVNDQQSQKGRLDFLAQLSGAFRDQVHTDILLQSADHGPAIAAHKAILATRSNIFKNMLASDSCKAPPEDTITLPEMNHQELDAFLDFMYSGQLTKEVQQKHISSLMCAAHKYGIPFLESYCETEILKDLGVNNALDALELSDACSNQKLKDAIINFIVENLNDMISSPKFDDFALAHPSLSLEILKASVRNPKKCVVGWRNA